MPRIAGVDIPDSKKVRFSLRYIFGIGPQTSDNILNETKINPDTKAKDLTDEEVGLIVGYLDANLVVEGMLRRQVQQNIQRLRDIGSYRGERHRNGLPVRGQRTRCNARTRKGRRKTVAGKKGVKG